MTDDLGARAGDTQQRCTLKCKGPSVGTVRRRQSTPIGLWMDSSVSVSQPLVLWVLATDLNTWGGHIASHCVPTQTGTAIHVLNTQRVSGVRATQEAPLPTALSSSPPVAADAVCSEGMTFTVGMATEQDVVCEVYCRALSCRQKI